MNCGSYSSCSVDEDLPSSLSSDSDDSVFVRIFSGHGKGEPHVVNNCVYDSRRREDATML